MKVAMNANFLNEVWGGKIILVSENDGRGVRNWLRGQSEWEN